MLLFDKEEVVLLVERVFEEDVELCEASKSNIDWAIVFLGLVVVVLLDVIVDGGSDDEATVGGCSEDFVSESDSDGSSDDDGTSSATVAVVLSLVFQLGLTMLLGKNNTPSSLLQPPW